MKSYTGPKMALVKRLGLGGAPRRAALGADDLFTVIMTDDKGNRVPLARGGLDNIFCGASRGEVAWYAACNAACSDDTIITVSVERL